MKRFIYSTVLLTALLALPACEVLETEPDDSLSSELVYTSGKNLEAVLVGAYSAVQGMLIDYTIMAELSSDNAEHTGSYPSWQEVDTYNLATNNAESGGVWASDYNVINLANNIITNGAEVPTDGTFSAARRDAIIAEAKVLRAFAYHDLVRWFGDVPLVLMPSEASGVDLYPARTAASEVYAQIIKDLTEAEATLGTTNRPAAYVDGYVAKALLARVYLYQGQWAQAAAKAQEVIAGPFTLGTVASIYDTQGSPESIWEVFYNTQDQNSLAFFAFPSNNGGRYEYAPTANLIAAFDTTDARFPYNIAYAGAAPVIVKYDDPVTGTDSQYAVRLAEMILTRAEALAQLNQLDEARTLLNRIRTRAGLANTTASSQAAVIDAVLAERRLELAFEGHRWHDLVRTGRAVGTLNIPSASRTLWPIPQRDIDLNRNLQQNEGY